MKPKYMVLLFLILSSIIVVSGCANNGNEQKEEEIKTVEDVSLEEEKTSEVVFPEEEMGNVVTNGLLIDTVIGEIYFPETWKENVTVQEISKEDEFEYVFNGKIEEYEIHLFTVVLTSGEKSEPKIGSIMKEDGQKLSVYILMPELQVDSSWSQVAIDTAYAMQEGVNYIVNQFYEVAGFTAE